MLNSGWNSSYKNLAKKTDVRECRVDDKPFSEIVVDVRSRLFRYMRITYANRTQQERALSVFRTIRDIRMTGEVVAEKRRVFDAALDVTKKEVSNMRVLKCTYVFPSLTPCPHKERMLVKRHETTKERLEELKRRIIVYKRNMFDLDALEQCALALESYIMSDIDGISTMRRPTVCNIIVPDESDSFESDKLCAKLAKRPGAAVLSEDFDNVTLFGADIMVKEAHVNFFVYVSLRDTMETLDCVRRKDAVHKCCIMGTDYNRGLKGVGPVKAKKIDAAEAKDLFEACMAAQSIKPDTLYGFFL